MEEIKNKEQMNVPTNVVHSKPKKNYGKRLAKPNAVKGLNKKSGEDKTALKKDRKVSKNTTQVKKQAVAKANKTAKQVKARASKSDSKVPTNVDSKVASKVETKAAFKKNVPQTTLFEIGANGFVPVKKEEPKEVKPAAKTTKATNKVTELIIGNDELEKDVVRKNRTVRNKKLKVVFLGGVGEIGKNMTALEYENDIIVIDSGLTFPDAEMPGIDVVVPDITYLLCNKEKIRGIILTHGHEDHIGGLPYVLNEINAPIFGSKLTIALVENKLREFPRIKYTANTVKPRQIVKLGCFSTEFIHVNHSIAGAMALSINTPVGQVVHTGDFKIDFSPINEMTTDLSRFAELGKKGVQLLLCESTNVERKGYTMSESTVGKTLDKLFEEYKEKRLFIATFASNIHRLQQIMDLAVKYKRKIIFSGRSMVNVSDTAMKCGELKFDKDIIIDIDHINRYKDSELLIITTGSQGEPMSALSRMANGEFNKIIIGENDCIILSASPIPGNEKMVYKIINSLYQKDATVIYHELADVHVSGHACQEELKTIHALVKPKFFIPVHGEYRHLKLHQNLAMSMGMEMRNTMIADLGNVIEISNNAITRGADVTSGSRLVDGYGVGDLESVVLRDRKQLSEDGMCVVLLHVDEFGFIDRAPDMISRGFIYNDEQNEVVSEAKEFLFNSLAGLDIKTMDKQVLKVTVRKQLTNFFSRKTKRKPLIITVIQ